MEANFFRFLLQELTPKLKGKRIQKVYKPFEGVWNFKLGSRRHLFFIPGRKRGALFYTDSQPDNPAHPSGEVQWWRKQLMDKKITDCLSLWSERQLALRLSTETPEITSSRKWIFLDLKQGLELSDTPPDRAFSSPSWLDLEDILVTPEIYTKYPQISPLLRKTLHNQSRAKSRSLLEFLQNATAEHFYLYSQDSRVLNILPWKLPPGILDESRTEIFKHAHEAAEKYGWNLLQEYIQDQTRSEKERKRRLKKIKRNIDRLEQDEKRLRDMASLQEKAELMQNHLYKFNPREKRTCLEILDYHGNIRHLDLDPGLTINQNMEQLFKKAHKGRRGLEAIEKRKKSLHSQWLYLENDLVHHREDLSRNKRKFEKSTQPKTPARLRGLQVHYFKSSQGFNMFRGKNKKSNHKLLTQAAKPFDFWFHVVDAPGAHLILQRDYSAQKVPRSNLLEAASLAALASFQSTENRASIMMALVKDVQTQKGADLGQVKVDLVQETLDAVPDRQLETRLKIS